ncbi:MAG: amidohydrolase family protein [Chloroflexota bacterium]|nr:amidohydrolase family protein [Chloroflexota bacterium]
MIFDAHCHAWQTWPYDRSVPDRGTRGSIEQLVYEMDSNGVDKALIVCAEIEGNPDNNQYVHEKTKACGDRFVYAVDVDSRWKDSYHSAGAADRLERAVTRWHPVAFTHYLLDDDAEGVWLHSEAGMAFFEVAASHGLIASIHCLPGHQAHIRKLAALFPQLRILIHHLGHPKVIEPETQAEVLASASCDNVYIKVSGFYNGTTQPKWDYPLADVQPVLQGIYRRYGADRLLWGSDYPVCRWFYSHRQAIEIVRHHCRFIPSQDMDKVMGKNLAGIL